MEGLDDALAALAAAQAGSGDDLPTFSAPNIRKSFTIPATVIGATMEIDVEREVYNAYQGYNALHFTSVQVIGVQTKNTYGTAEIADNLSLIHI